MEQTGAQLTSGRLQFQFEENTKEKWHHYHANNANPGNHRVQHDSTSFLMTLAVIKMSWKGTPGNSKKGASWLNGSRSLARLR
jgi:hypothetical protein